MRNSGGIEIERKFLLKKFPRHVEKKNGVLLRQGYISSEAADVEVRIRSAGEKRYLTLKKGRGMVRREEEIIISAENFESFWPFTLGARVKKTRYSIEQAGVIIEIDEYHDALAPLVIAEIELPPGASFTGMVLPDWLGVEITGVFEFTNQHLARHGLPEEPDAIIGQTTNDKTRPIIQAGALPFRRGDNGLEVLCITTGDGKQWTIPKGTWDGRCDLDEIASMSAAETAGVAGTLDTRALGIYDDEGGGGGGRVELFALRVEQQKEKWPEMSLSDRRWFDIDRAIATVSHPGIVRMIEKLRDRLSPA